MQRREGAAPRAGLAALFFMQGVAMAAWFVPLSPVLEAYGFGGLRAYAFATSAVAALVTPLVFGAVADRHMSPLVVLRAAAVGSAVFMASASWAISHRWPAMTVLGLIQLQSLVATPTWSLLTSIVLAGLTEPKRQFGPVRAFGTFGWIGGCLLVSVLRADASPVSGYAGAAMWVVLALFSLTLPMSAPPAGGGSLTVRQRLGLDALELLRVPEHRAVLVTAGLLSAGLAAFYPFTPGQLRDLGLVHTSAWMSLAQATEVLAMFGLAGWLARWRLKVILGAGLGFAVLRYGLLSTDTRGWVLLGVSLHGLAFTLFFISVPIYLNEHIPAAWRTRAQALFSLMTQGLGNLAGYLGAGWWLEWCLRDATMHWSQYWGALTLWVVGVGGYFLVSFRGPPLARPGVVR